jgi:cytochrome c553
MPLSMRPPRARIRRPAGLPPLLLTMLLAAALRPAMAAGVPDTIAQRALACTACHGARDQDTPRGYVPRIAGKPAGYLFEQMRNFRDGRRAHDGMARLMQHLDDRYLQELANHFASLPPSRHAPAARPVTEAETRRATGWVRQGDPRADIPACEACHGATLAGVAPHVPGLLGLPADYLVVQLGAWRQGTRHARAPDCMARIARALPAEDVPALARWLAAQPLPADPSPSNRPPATWPMHCGSIPP